ncbi:mannose-1-phosphate guanylyltransferase [Candidatus Daviesbacteria bacterium]|nr:mannose-1-phosphate guanylyltransferase [Candidatus Daviesbacteria bacterium]
MKIVVFAGGVGTRLWPLSRKNTPKQFEKIVDNKSMLQISIAKVLPDFSWNDIYISTNAQYKDILKDQFPQIPEENLIFEPCMRDVGPAVGLTIANFIKKLPKEEIAILWGDHLIKKEEEFRNALKTAGKLIEQDPQKIVFVGQKPRFASVNLGYIEFGDEIKKEEETSVYEFKAFKYRPDEQTANKFLEDGKHAWNLGYFVTTPKFLWNMYEKFAPDLFGKLKQISDAVETEDYEKVLNEVYPTIAKISFDNAILEKIDPSDGMVLSVDIGWSDIGAWEALKEALAGTEDENVTKGNVELVDSKDNLVFNYNGQLTVGIDLEGMLVINMGDVLLVCPKSSVPKIKKYVEGLAGTPNEKLV